MGGPEDININREVYHSLTHHTLYVDPYIFALVKTLRTASSLSPILVVYSQMIVVQK